GQEREVVELPREVRGGRGAEDVGAVADRGDDGLVRRAELHPERGAKSPAEATGVGRAEAGPGPGGRRVSDVERVLVDDDRARVEDLADAAGRPLEPDGPALGFRRRGPRPALALRPVLGGEPGAPRRP